MENQPSPVPQQKENKAIQQITTLFETSTKDSVERAIEIRDKFLEWGEKEYPELYAKSKGKTLRDRIDQSPSRNLARNSLLASAAATFGLSYSVNEYQLDMKDIGNVFLGFFGGPVLEELVFRSKKIPDFFSHVGNEIGLPVRKDQARLLTNTIFATGHLRSYYDKNTNVFQFLNTFALGSLFQKVSHERGMAASIALHSLWNAATTIWDLEVGVLQKWAILHSEDKVFVQRYKNASKFKYGIQIAALVGIGIVGLKELLDDRNTQKLFMSIRGKQAPLDVSDFIKTHASARKLLSAPSTDGYKFEAGIELAYMGSALTMPSSLKDMMSPDEYARSQVHQMVMETWKDKKTLPRRLEKANTYISEQLTKRAQQS